MVQSDRSGPQGDACLHIYLGPVVQSVVSLTSSFVIKMLTVLVSTISKSQLFFADKKCE